MISIVDLTIWIESKIHNIQLNMDDNNHRSIVRIESNIDSVQLLFIHELQNTPLSCIL